MVRVLDSPLSDGEHDLLSAFITQSLPKNWSYKRHVLEFLLYLTPDKPATEFSQLYPADEFTNLNNLPTNGFAHLVDEFTLPHTRVAQPLTNDLVNVTYECLPNEDSSLPDTDLDGDSYHQAWGDHYSYPESAIHAYINNTCLRYTSNPDDQKRLQSLIDQTVYTPDDLKRLPLVSFLPPDTPTGLEDALRIALNRDETLLTTAKTYDLPEITTLRDDVITSSPFGDDEP